MARTCESCKRGYMKSASRSHSNIKSLRRQHLNLQSKVVNGLRIAICTRCIKTMAKATV